MIAAPTQSASVEPTYYEVVWGCGEHERTARVDYHDGSAVSRDAEMLATRVFISMAPGVVAGFYVAGELKAGTAHTCKQCDPPAVEHLTRTYQRLVGERYVTKSNGSCGRWRKEYETTWVCSCGNGGFGRNNDRADARERRVRGHRPEQRRLSAQHADVRDTVTAQRQRGRQIQQRLARIVTRPRRPPRRQRRRHPPAQPGTRDRLLDQQRARGRDQRLTTAVEDQCRNQTNTTATLHLRSAFHQGPCDFSNPKSSQVNRHFRAFAASVAADLVKRRG